MNIECGCVILRAIEKRDMTILKSLINDPSVEYMAGGCSFPVSEESQLKWFESFDGQKDLRCMIDITNSGTIGTIGLSNIDLRNRKAEIYYKVDRNNEKRVKGDINDAVKGILTYAFDELNLNCIIGEAIEYNIPSQKILTKFGFQQEGVLRKRFYKKGKYHDLYVYSLLKEEFEEQENSNSSIK